MRDLDTIDGLTIEVNYIKAQLEILADHFEGGSSFFNHLTYANFVHSISAGVERLENNINQITTGGAQ